MKKGKEITMKIKSLFMAAMLAMALLAGLPAQASDPVNINTATVEQLQELKGIGPKTAEAIVAYRSEHGSFKSIDDLKQVKGVGDKSLGKIRDNLTTGN